MSSEDTCCFFRFFLIYEKPLKVRVTLNILVTTPNSIHPNYVRPKNLIFQPIMAQLYKMVFFPLLPLTWRCEIFDLIPGLSYTFYTKCWWLYCMHVTFTMFVKVKFIYSEKATKFFEISTLDLTVRSGDFAKFGGLLRIYELYVNGGVCDNLKEALCIIFINF